MSLKNWTLPYTSKAHFTTFLSIILSIAFTPITTFAKVAEDRSDEESESGFYIDCIPPTFIPFEEEYTVSSPSEIAILIANDDCSEAKIYFEDEIVKGHCENTYEVIRNYKAEDESGNIAEARQLIHVVDQEGPQIYGIDEFVCGDVSIPEISLVDNCGSANIDLFMQEDTLHSRNCNGQLLLRRLFSAIDACGNVTEVEQLITVDDNTPPELVYSDRLKEFIGKDVVINFSDANSLAIVNQLKWNSVLGQESCSGQFIDPQFTENIVENFGETSEFIEKRMYVWEVMDECGNANSITTNVFIKNNI